MSEQNAPDELWWEEVKFDDRKRNMRRVPGEAEKLPVPVTHRRGAVLTRLWTTVDSGRRLASASSLTRMIRISLSTSTRREILKLARPKTGFSKQSTGGGLR